MGLHLGVPKVVRDPMTRRVEYIGPVVNTAARITAMTHGGQIVMTHAVHAKAVSDFPSKRLVSLGAFELPDTPGGMRQSAYFSFILFSSGMTSCQRNIEAKDAYYTSLMWLVFVQSWS